MKFVQNTHFTALIHWNFSEKTLFEKVFKMLAWLRGQLNEQDKLGTTNPIKSIEILAKTYLVLNMIQYPMKRALANIKILQQKKSWYTVKNIDITNSLHLFYEMNEIFRNQVVLLISLPFKIVSSECWFKGTLQVKDKWGSKWPLYACYNSQERKKIKSICEKGYGNFKNHLLKALKGFTLMQI